ncbi:hypothetical protein BP6252_02300 [Coleophoma cylindrospora]|uniref:Uncharacterized protein n=1 Tax=Coleophoma cylindrospora TaxID=1849047 RepID=A0A3D8SEE9_9HELO|nr:hypothetical protein BP6252_02300 [Coleophoma cylindrospora]
MTKITVPDFFPPLTLLPQRALCYIKAKFPAEVFEKAYLALFNAMWVPPNVNVTVPEEFRSTVAEMNLFNDKEVDEIVHAPTEKEWKDCLLANTQKVLDQGAFGAPWFWVKNAEGNEEPFFGSDRFHFMWAFLGIPFNDIKIVAKEGKAKL